MNPTSLDSAPRPPLASQALLRHPSSFTTSSCPSSSSVSLCSVSVSVSFLISTLSQDWVCLRLLFVLAYYYRTGVFSYCSPSLASLLVVLHSLSYRYSTLKHLFLWEIHCIIYHLLILVTYWWWLSVADFRPPLCSHGVSTP